MLLWRPSIIELLSKDKSGLWFSLSGKACDNFLMSEFKDVIDPATHIVDSELFVIEAEVNWLEMVSPTHNDLRWQTFKDSGFKSVMPLRYPEVNVDLKNVRKRLNKLPFDEIGHSVVAALLKEKKEEINLQIDLVEERDQEGFLSTSIALFGGSEPRLLRKAREILAKVPFQDSPEPQAGAEQMLQAAQEMKANLKKICPDFDFEAKIVEDLNSMMMVNHGVLYLARDLHVPESRVRPLIAHEVETHVVTRYNGRRQPLRLLECGLAYYDSLQEGLATLGEYLTGNLPARRLRTLAARVVATDMAIHEESVENIFSKLHEEHQMDPEDAFDTAVRAKRGGGLTKDAVYLEGLVELLECVKAGEDIEMLFLGKFALEQREMLKKLLKQKILSPPALLPEFITSKEGKDLIRQVREMDITELYH